MPTRTRKKIEVLECCAVCEQYDETEGRCILIDCAVNHHKWCGSFVIDEYVKKENEASK